jgi:hypothetical protein
MPGFFTSDSFVLLMDRSLDAAVQVRVALLEPLDAYCVCNWVWYHLFNLEDSLPI